MSDLERAAAGMICAGFAGTSITDEVRALIRRGVRSFILMGRNCESPAQVEALSAEIRSVAGPRVRICIDQEGGRVQRLREPFVQVPTMRELGRRGDVEAIRKTGFALGSALRNLGINMNLAPVLDVDSNPANPVIGDRAFSSDSRIVASIGCAMIEGLQSAGVAACGKHFPGHGDTILDSHLALPRLPHGMDRLNEIELPPFAAAIRAGVAAIMTAHVVFDAIDPGVPATMSRAVIHDLLRARMGFGGVVISDDLEMKAIADHYGIEEAVKRGAAAGSDLFLICHDHERQHHAIDALTRAAGDNSSLAQQLRASAERRARLGQFQK